LRSARRHANGGIAGGRVVAALKKQTWARNLPG